MNDASQAGELASRAGSSSSSVGDANAPLELHAQAALLACAGLGFAVTSWCVRRRRGDCAAPVIGSSGSGKGEPTCKETVTPLLNGSSSSGEGARLAKSPPNAPKRGKRDEDANMASSSASVASGASPVDDAAVASVRPSAPAAPSGEMPLVAFAGGHFPGAGPCVDLRQPPCSFGGQLDGALSVSFVARWDALHSWSRVIDFGNGSATDNVTISNFEKGKTLVADVYRGTSRKRLVMPGAITLGETRRYLFTVSESGCMRMVRDEVQLGELPGGYAPRAVERSRLLVGGSSWPSDGHFQGHIADLKVWGSVVSWDTAFPGSREAWTDLPSSSSAQLAVSSPGILESESQEQSERVTKLLAKKAERKARKAAEAQEEKDKEDFDDVSEEATKQPIVEQADDIIDALAGVAAATGEQLDEADHFGEEALERSMSAGAGPKAPATWEEDEAPVAYSPPVVVDRSLCSNNGAEAAALLAQQSGEAPATKPSRRWADVPREELPPRQLAGVWGEAVAKPDEGSLATASAPSRCRGGSGASGGSCSSGGRHKSQSQQEDVEPEVQEGRFSCDVPMPMVNDDNPAPGTPEEWAEAPVVWPMQPPSHAPQLWQQQPANLPRSPERTAFVRDSLKLEKKVREVEKLQQRQSDGEFLAANELDKISKLSEMQARLAEMQGRQEQTCHRTDAAPTMLQAMEAHNASTGMPAAPFVAGPTHMPMQMPSNQIAPGQLPPGHIALTGAAPVFQPQGMCSGFSTSPAAQPVMFGLTPQPMPPQRHVGRTPLRAPRRDKESFTPSGFGAASLQQLHPCRLGPGAMQPENPMAVHGGWSSEPTYNQVMQDQQFQGNGFTQVDEMPMLGGDVMQNPMSFGSSFPAQQSLVLQVGLQTESQTQDDRWEACWEWMNTGWCPRGDTCRWEHPDLGSLVPAPCTDLQNFQQWPDDQSHGGCGWSDYPQGILDPSMPAMHHE